MHVIANISQRGADDAMAELSIRAELTGMGDGWLLSVVVQREGHRLIGGLWVDAQPPLGAEGALSRQLEKIAAAPGHDDGNLARQHILLAKQAIESRLARRSHANQPMLSATQLRTAMALLGTDLHAPLPVRHIAASCRISESHLRKGFRTCTGLSPQQWRQSERLKFCRQQLLQSNAALATIARAAGFPVPNYFSRVFTQSSGLPPSDWRRIFRSAVAGRSSLQSHPPTNALGAKQDYTYVER